MSITLFLVAGRVIGAALACGLNLYATVALVGFASRFGLIELPPGLNGLEQWLLIGAAVALFLVEFVASAIPFVDSSWEAVHTVVRPLGAAALTMVALESVPLPLRIAGVLLAGIAAFAAHMAKVGLRLVVTTRRTARLVISTIEDIAAACLAIAALIVPVVALAVVAVFAGLLAVVGPGLWRATTFAARALVALLRGFFESRGWRPLSELPARVRARVPPTEVGLPDPRLVRATLSSTATGAWRNGWLVVDTRSARFLFTRTLRQVEVLLPRANDATVDKGLLADIVHLQRDETRFTLRLLKDGPPAELVVGALQLVIE